MTNHVCLYALGCCLALFEPASAQSLPAWAHKVTAVPTSQQPDAPQSTNGPSDYDVLPSSAGYGPLGKPRPFTAAADLPQFARVPLEGGLTERLNEKLIWLRNACAASISLKVQTDPEAVSEVRALDNNIRVAFYEIRTASPAVIERENVTCLHRVEDQEITGAEKGGMASRVVGPSAVVSGDDTGNGLYISSTVQALMANPVTRRVLAKDVPELFRYQDQASIRKLPLDVAVNRYFSNVIDHARVHSLKYDLAQVGHNDQRPANSQQGKVVHF